MHCTNHIDVIKQTDEVLVSRKHTSEPTLSERLFPGGFQLLTYLKFLQVPYSDAFN